MLGRLINLHALLSKKILHILNGDLRLCFTGGGLQILDLITSRTAKIH